MSPVPLHNCTTSTDHLLTPEDCAICLDTIVVSSTTHTPCNNSFCTPCLTTWVNFCLTAGNAPTCPICRGSLVAENPTFRTCPRSTNPTPPPSPYPPSLTPYLHIARTALPLPHLSALLSLLGRHPLPFQPSPIPRLPNHLLTSLYYSGLMDPITQSESIQRSAVATHGTREWGIFAFPGPEEAAELGVGEEGTRYFLVPMRVGGERNGEFVVGGRRWRRFLRAGYELWMM
jgi:hypothetical protein